MPALRQKELVQKFLEEVKTRKTAYYIAVNT